MMNEQDIQLSGRPIQTRQMARRFAPTMREKLVRHGLHPGGIESTTGSVG
jgi:hypothetical protein